ncbi:MAG: radical SAM family heme chaperone HemW [Bacillota bacterium]
MKVAGLYIHVPFCISKCFYCDFVSYPYAKEPAECYAAALEKEILLRSQEIRNQAVFESIYLGGGTPTCLPVPILRRILAVIRENFEILPQAEITVEANPGTARKNLLRMLRHEGVNRLSIGMQTGEAGLLLFLGRRHTPADVVKMVEEARDAGFDNLNLDLIFGIPGQTVLMWKKSLKDALALRPEHISTYGLEIHPGTPLGRSVEAGEISLCPEEDEREMYLEAIDFLAVCGYEQYEISNFALPGKASRHNRLYWEGEPYLGIGPAAHSYFNGCRWSNAEDIDVYCGLIERERLPVVWQTHLSVQDEMSEAMFLGLRELAGVSCRRFRERFGQRPEKAYGREIQQLLERGLLTREGDFLRLTREALPVANVVFGEFV